MESTAIYLRVSSNHQKFDSQLPDLQRWVENNKDLKIRWFKDKFTGKTMDRPGFSKLMVDVQAGNVKNIVIWRMDRLGRTAAGLTLLFNHLLDKKVNLISLKDGFDLSQPQGRLLANLLASVAQFENELRSERVLSGQTEAKRKGKKWGGSKKGHRKSKTSEKIKAVHTLHQQGVAKAEISRIVCLSIPTVYSILKNK